MPQKSATPPDIRRSISPRERRPPSHITGMDTPAFFTARQKAAFHAGRNGMARAALVREAEEAPAVLAEAVAALVEHGGPALLEDARVRAREVRAVVARLRRIARRAAERLRE